MREDVPFGNFRICKRRLGKGILSFRYGKSNHGIYDLPNKPVSKHVQTFIGGLLDNPVNETKIKEHSLKLSNDERNYIQKISERSGMYINPEFLEEQVEAADLQKLKTQFDICIGELSQGNDNLEIKKELQLIIQTMLKSDIITENMYESIYKKYIG
jgi:hypothetical protein